MSGKLTEVNWEAVKKIVGAYASELSLQLQDYDNGKGWVGIKLCDVSDGQCNPYENILFFPFNTAYCQVAEVWGIRWIGNIFGAKLTPLLVELGIRT